MLAIYELEGDTLKIAWVVKQNGKAIERPTHFKATWKDQGAEGALELKREQANGK